MFLTLDFWAAARLVAFANLQITEANWESLWPHIPGRRKVGELWETYKNDLRIYGEPPGHRETVAKAMADTFRQPQAAVEAFRRLESNMLALPMAAWPDVGDNGRPVRYLAFSELHERARKHLAAICGDDLKTVVRTLKKYRPLPRRFDAYTRVLADTKAQQRKENQRLTRATTAFEFVEVRRKKEPLGDHIATLFIRTAMSGLWPRFFRCAAEECQRFGLMKLVGRPHNFCSDQCRTRWRQSKTRKKRPIASADAVKRFRARLAALEKSGAAKPWVTACREFGYPSSGPPSPG